MTLLWVNNQNLQNIVTQITLNVIKLNINCIKMKRRLMLIITFFLLLITSFSSFSQVKSNSKSSVGIQTGYNRGLGIIGNYTIHHIAEGLPGNLRFGIGYNWLNPGNAADARRIFINNATNGVAEKKGKSFDFRIDYMMSHKFFNLKDSYLVFGPRYSSFTANFNYIGGNENFDVTSKQWGIGLGAESYFKINSRLDLVFATGLDYFFRSTLKGHDTSYSPNNDNINPRNDNQNGNVPFEYKDANKAIKQPQLMPRIMVGVVYRL